MPLVFDDCTTSESVSLQIVNRISVSDSSTATENSVVSGPYKLISVTDSSTVTESPSISPSPKFPSVTDSSTITENVVVRVVNYGWVQVFITSTQTWTVPDDFNPAHNTIEAIGGGGGGAQGGASVNAGAGGGGGAYSRAENASLTPGGSVTVTVGNGGAGGTVGPGGDGGDTSLVDGATTIVLAKGGKGATNNSVGGLGGATASGVGSVKYAGGQGGSTVGVSFSGGGGGGGAAGPNGEGGKGGNTTNGAGSGSGGGGGGNGGGSDGANGPIHGADPGGAGGNNYLGYGGGINGGAAATDGGGGNGGGILGIYRDGSNGIDFDSTHGSGGGGGGDDRDNANPVNSGAGGLYGGGSGGTGGGGGNAANAAQGLLVVTYLSTRSEAVSDSITVTESVSIVGTSSLSVSDTSSVSEDVSLQPLNPFELFVTDTSTVSEDVAFRILNAFEIFVWDDSTVTDPPAGVPVGIGGIPIFCSSFDSASPLAVWTTATGVSVTSSGRDGDGCNVGGGTLSVNGAFGDNCVAGMASNPSQFIQAVFILADTAGGKGAISVRLENNSPAGGRIALTLSASLIGTVTINLEGSVRTIGTWNFIELGAQIYQTVRPIDPHTSNLTVEVDAQIYINNSFIGSATQTFGPVAVLNTDLPAGLFSTLTIENNGCVVDDVYVDHTRIGDCRVLSDDKTVVIDSSAAPDITQALFELGVQYPAVLDNTQTLIEVGLGPRLFIAGYIASQGKWVQS